MKTGRPYRLFIGDQTSHPQTFSTLEKALAAMTKRPLGVKYRLTYRQPGTRKDLPIQEKR